MRLNLSLALLCAAVFCAPTLRGEDWKPITPEDLRFTEPGAPAKVLRELTPADVQGLRANAAGYVARAHRYRSQLRRMDGGK